MRWELTGASQTKAIEQLLADGWEPFAVAPDGAVYFRRQVLEVEGNGGYL